jgi:hypothetical protein
MALNESQYIPLTEQGYPQALQTTLDQEFQRFLAGVDKTSPRMDGAHFSRNDRRLPVITASNKYLLET